MPDDQPTDNEAPVIEYSSGVTPADDLVTLSTFQTASAAQPLRIALEDAGIAVFIADDNAVTVNWLWGPALGYVKVQVPRSQSAAAVEIAKQHVPVGSDNADRTNDEERPSTCLACGAAMPESSDRCPNCGWTYNTAAGDGDEPGDDDEAGEAAEPPVAQ